MHKRFAAVSSGETHSPAVAFANHCPARGTGKAGPKGSGDGKAPFRSAIGNDAHRIAPQIVRALENPDGRCGFGADNTALAGSDLKRVVRFDARVPLIRRGPTTSREEKGRENQ